MDKAFLLGSLLKFNLSYNVNDFMPKYFNKIDFII